MIPSIVECVAFEDLEVYDMVRSYYHKVKKTTETAEAIGIVVPFYNKSKTKRGEKVRIGIRGIVYATP